MEQALLTESSLPLVGRNIEPAASPPFGRFARRNERQKLSVLKVTRDAENIFHRYRWALGIVVCPYCGSIHVTQSQAPNRFAKGMSTSISVIVVRTGLMTRLEPYCMGVSLVYRYGC